MMGRQEQPLRLLTLAMSAALVLLAGCSVQEATVSDDATLVAEPVMDASLNKDDFSFPSEPPSLKRGKKVFESSCMSCHAQSFWQQGDVKHTLAYTTPIDYYLMLTTGEKPDEHMKTKQRQDLLPAHQPAFRDKLSRDDRWAVVFYTRYLAGAGDIQAPNAKAPGVDAIFGGNCAVCHGKRGYADGTLHIGKTGNHHVSDGDVFHNLQPAPANFHDYKRMYNRSDAQLHKYICEGIYPSAMPAWYGDVFRDKDTGESVYVFNAALISDLVRHVRTFAYNNDLDVDPATAPKGLDEIANCETTYTNQPWTQQMNKAGLSKSKGWTQNDQPWPHDDATTPAGAAHDTSKHGGEAH